MTSTLEKRYPPTTLPANITDNTVSGSSTQSIVVPVSANPYGNGNYTFTTSGQTNLKMKYAFDDTIGANEINLGLYITNPYRLTTANTYEYVYDTIKSGPYTLVSPSTTSAIDNNVGLWTNGAFDGTSANINYNAPCLGNNTRSIYFYFSTTQQGPNKAMTSWGGSSVAGESFTIYLHNGGIQFSCGGTNYTYDFTTFSNLNDGNVHSLICTYDNTNNSITMLIDNISETKTLTTDYTTLASNAVGANQVGYFGCLANSPNNSSMFFQGKLHYLFTMSAYKGNELRQNYSPHLDKFADPLSTTFTSLPTGIDTSGHWVKITLPSVTGEVGATGKGIVPTKFIIGGSSTDNNTAKNITIYGGELMTGSTVNYTKLVDNAENDTGQTFTIYPNKITKSFTEFVFIVTRTMGNMNQVHISEVGVYGYEPTQNTYMDSTGIGSRMIDPIYKGDFSSVVFDGTHNSYVNIIPNSDISGNTPFTIELSYEHSSATNTTNLPILSIGRSPANMSIVNDISPGMLSIGTEHTATTPNNHYSLWTNADDGSVANFTDASINVLNSDVVIHHLVVSVSDTSNISVILDGVATHTYLYNSNALSSQVAMNLGNGENSPMHISLGQSVPTYSFATETSYYFDGTNTNTIELLSSSITYKGAIVRSDDPITWVEGTADRAFEFEMRTDYQNTDNDVMISHGNTSGNYARIIIFLDSAGKLCIGIKGDNVCMDSDAGVRDNAWHHIKISYTATLKEIKIYVDRVLKKTGQFTNAINTTGTNSARLGSNVGSGNNYKGYLRNIFFYSNAMTQPKFIGKIRKVAVYKDLFIKDTHDLNIMDFGDSCPAINTITTDQSLSLKIHGTGALQIPNNAIDPDIVNPSFSKGTIYYNSTLNCYKGYDGSSWKTIKGGVINEAETVYAQSDTNLSLFTSHIGGIAILDLNMDSYTFDGTANNTKSLEQLVGTNTRNLSTNRADTPITIVLSVKFASISDSRILNNHFNIDSIPDETETGEYRTTFGIDATGHWSRSFGYLDANGDAANNVDLINNLAAGTDFPATVADKDYTIIIAYDGATSVTYTVRDDVTDTSVSITETQTYYENLILDDGITFGGTTGKYFDGTINYFQIHHKYFATYSDYSTHISAYTVLSSVNEDITINSYGNIGIGKTNPTTTLDADGCIAISKQLVFYDTRANNQSTMATVNYNRTVSNTSTSNPSYQYISIEHENGMRDADGNVNNILRLGDGMKITTNSETTIDFNETNTRIKNGPGNAELNVGGSMSVGSTYYGTPLPDNTIHVEGSVGIGTTNIGTNSKMTVYDKTNSNNTIHIRDNGELTLDNSGSIVAENIMRFPPGKTNSASFRRVVDHATLTDANGTSANATEQIDVYFDVTHTNLSYGKGRYYMSMANIYSDNLGYTYIFDGSPPNFYNDDTEVANDHQMLGFDVGVSGKIYDSTNNYEANNNAPNYNNLGVYGWWFSMQFPNPFTLNYFISSLEDGDSADVRRQKRFFVFATNDDVDFHRVGYFGGSGNSGTQNYSQSVGDQYAWYNEKGKDQNSGSFSKYVFIITRTAGSEMIMALSSFRAYGTHGKVKIHKNLHASRAYIGSKTPYYSYATDRELYFDGTGGGVITLPDAFICIKGGAPRTYELEFKTNSTVETMCLLATGNNSSQLSFTFKLFNGKFMFYGQYNDWTSTTGTDLRDNVWHHLKVTFDNGRMTLYVDGNKYESIVVGGALDNYIGSNINTTKDKNYLGRAANNTLHLYKGYIRNVNFYDHVSESSVTMYSNSIALSDTIQTPTITPYYTYGTTDQIYSFNGASSIDLTADGFSCINGGNNRTIELEFKTSSTPNAKMTLISTGTTIFTNNDNRIFNLNLASNGKFTFMGYANDWTSTTGTDLRDGVWHHLRVTFYNGRMTLYIDQTRYESLVVGGALESYNGSAINTFGDQNFLGKSNNSSNVDHYYTGDMRNVKFYDTAIDADAGPNRIMSGQSGIGVETSLTKSNVNYGTGIGNLKFYSENDSHVFETNNHFMDLTEGRLVLPGYATTDLSLNNNRKNAMDFNNNVRGINVKGAVQVEGDWTDAATDINQRTFGHINNNTIRGKITNEYVLFDGSQNIYNHSVTGGYADYAVVDIDPITFTNTNYTAFLYLDHVDQVDDPSYNVSFSYEPTFDVCNNQVYSYYKTHGIGAGSPYNVYDSGSSLVIAHVSSAALVFDTWTDASYTGQNVLTLGEPNSSFNYTSFVALPQSDASELLSNDTFSIMFHAEIVKGTDANAKTGLLGLSYNDTYTVMLMYTGTQFFIASSIYTGNAHIYSNAIDIPPGINQYVLTIAKYVPDTGNVAKFYLNGTVVLTYTLLTTNNRLSQIPTGGNNYWAIGNQSPRSLSGTSFAEWPMKIYNIATFTKELSGHEVNQFKMFSPSQAFVLPNAMSDATSSCYYGNVTIPHNKRVTNAIIERPSTYDTERIITKLSIIPDHDGTSQASLLTTRLVTHSEVATYTVAGTDITAVPYEHLEIQGNDILSGSSIHLSAEKNIIIENLDISGTIYNEDGTEYNYATDKITVVNNAIRLFQISADSGGAALKIDASFGGTSTMARFSTVVDSSQNTHVGFSNQAGMHIMPDGYAGEDDKNGRGTMNQYAGLDVSGTIFGIYPVGAIMMYPVTTLTSDSIDNNLPPGWKLCNGDIISRTTYSLLFGILGDIYGAGDGTSTFKLPNFNQDFYPIGDDGNMNAYTGAGNSQMSTNQMSGHSHTVSNFTVADYKVSGNNVKYKESSNHRLPQLSDDVDNEMYADVKTSNNSVKNYFGLLNIITPAGTYVDPRKSGVKYTGNFPIDGNEMYNRLATQWHQNGNSNDNPNILDLSSVEYDVSYNPTIASIGGTDNWLPSSTNMKSIIYTGIR